MPFVEGIMQFELDLDQWPMKVDSDPQRGRFLVASQTIPSGSLVFVSHAYCRTISKSFKKRICAFCFLVSPKRLDICCPRCKEVFYCSSQCRDDHMLKNKTSDNVYWNSTANDDGFLHLGNISVCSNGSIKFTF